MKSFLYKLGTHAAVTLTLLLLTFAPFVSLTAQAATTNTTTPSTTELFGACSLTDFSPSGCLSSIIYAFTIGIGSFFAYVAAYFFDITIQLSLNGASYGLDFISTSWTTARDLGNMAFLFILIYIAFTIIFKADTGQTKTMLAVVIIVALLVNFSFFFTRVVIDAGNILSIQFYNAIPAPPISQTIQGSTAVISSIASVSSSIGGTSPGTKDLTAGIMGLLNVQGLLNNNSFQQTNGNFIAKILIYLAGAIVLWILTIAFVTSGIKFLYRVVVLWLLIVASPLALISLAVPTKDKYFTQWRETLVQHAFYPVVFMFMFLILNNFASTLASNKLTGGVFTTLQTGDATSFGAIGASLVALAIRLALVIAMLYAGMKASDRFSVYGASTAGNIGGWFGDKFKSTLLMPARLAGVGARESLGRVATNDLNTLKKNPSTNWAGRLADRAYSKGVLAPIAGAKFGTANSFADAKAIRDKDSKAVTEANNDLDNKDKVKILGDKISSNIKAGVSPAQGMSDDEKKKIQNLNKRDLEAMNAEQIGKISALLTEDQMKRVKEMESLTDKEKEEIEKTWNDHSTAAPVHKASKALSDLKKANSRLSSPDPDIAANTDVNTHVNKIVLDSLKTKVEAKLDETLANRTAVAASLDQLSRTNAPAAQVNAAKLQFASAEAEHRNATKMAEYIKTASEQAGNVQPHHGNVAASGEFKIKSV